MGLNARRHRDPRLIDVPGIALLMRPVLEQWFTARIAIEDPELDKTTPYDPRTDTGGTTEPTVLFEGDALVQPLPGATTTVFGDQQLSIGAVRIQVGIPADVALRSGLRVRILASENDHVLALRPMSLDDVATGSLAWDKILMARVLGS